MDFTSFVVNHDDYKPFLLVYIVGSAVIAVFFGLFYFLLWILVHFALELYKRKIILGGISVEDFLISLHHCRLDFYLFFLGLSIDAVVHARGAVALGRIGGLVRSERILDALNPLTRFIGTVKVTKSISQVCGEILHGKGHIERGKLKVTKFDTVLLLIAVISLLLSFTYVTLREGSILSAGNIFIHILLP